MDSGFISQHILLCPLSFRSFYLIIDIHFTQKFNIVFLIAAIKCFAGRYLKNDTFDEMPTGYYRIPRKFPNWRDTICLDYLWRVFCLLDWLVLLAANRSMGELRAPHARKGNLTQISYYPKKGIRQYIAILNECFRMYWLIIQSTEARTIGWKGLQIGIFIFRQWTCWEEQEFLAHRMRPPAQLNRIYALNTIV